MEDRDYVNVSGFYESNTITLKDSRRTFTLINWEVMSPWERFWFKMNIKKRMKWKRWRVLLQISFNLKEIIKGDIHNCSWRFSKPKLPLYKNPQEIINKETKNNERVL